MASSVAGYSSDRFSPVMVDANMLRRVRENAVCALPLALKLKKVA
jgi:hypothetical protein